MENEKYDIDLELDPPDEWEDDESNYKCFGSIDLDEDILNEKGFGSVNLGSNNKVGVCNVYVYEIEGPIAHFHLKSNGFETCVRIYEPLYFKHDGKEGELNSQQRKKLDNWLSSKSDNDSLKTRWEEISEYWDSVHGRPKGATNIKPDYRKLR